MPTGDFRLTDNEDDVLCREEVESIEKHILKHFQHFDLLESRPVY